MTGTAGVIDLSLWQLAVAVLLVAVVILVSIREGLALERDLLIGWLRTIVQLYLVGLILAAVFAAARWYWVLLILAVMTGVATQAGSRGSRSPSPAGTRSRPRRSPSRPPRPSPT